MNNENNMHIWTKKKFKKAIIIMIIIIIEEKSEKYLMKYCVIYK